jgi:peptidoglycan/LPS O-acetylase OafA/YrhL
VRLAADHDAEPLAPASAPAHGFYSPQLDGLRFLAAFAVFVHHAPAVPSLGALKTYGWAGVDLFLVISAYLLTRLLMLEYEATGRISIKSFFVRRALRIWPLYLGYVTAITLLAIVAGKLAFVTASYWWLSHVSFSNNILTAVKGYSVVPYTAHLWTISLEEQAYLVLPFVLAACLGGRSSPRGLLSTGIAIVALMIVARAALVLAGVQHPFIWVLPLRADGIVLGTVVALAMPPSDRGRGNLLLALGIAGLVSVGLFPSIEVAGAYQVFGYSIVAASCCALVLATQAPGMILNRLLGSVPMRLLGKVSFGFYVYHAVMLYIAEKLLSRLGIGPGPAVFVLGLVLTIAAAILSYHFYERPFLKFKKRFTMVKSRPI